MKPERLSVDDLMRLDATSTGLWAGERVRRSAAGQLPLPGYPLFTGPAGLTTIVAVGGGTLLDAAKFTARRDFPSAYLIAVPTIWGSGAEQSPVVVLNEEKGKRILVDEAFVPDACVYWYQLTESLDPGRIRAACGDAWAHAVEGFLSPLATEEQRRELAALIREMLELPIARDPRWFEISGRASRLQAAASVGLVHGIAHVIEMLVRARLGEEWGHARLCATLLRPVLEFDLRASDRAARLFDQHGLDVHALLAAAGALSGEGDYQAILPDIAAEWGRILREPSTRTNVALVRREHAGQFTS